MDGIALVLGVMVGAWVVSHFDEVEDEAVGNSPKYKKILQKYGNPGTKPHPTKKGHVVCNAAWVGENIVKRTLHTGQVVWLHKGVADHFVMTYQAACTASGMTPKHSGTWVPRHIGRNTSKPLSLHTWGIAIDFDAPNNPVGGVKKNGQPSDLRTEKGRAFVSVFKAAGFTWGGDWNMQDDMHFEFV